jgi:hypothetical protein
MESSLLTYNYNVLNFSKRAMKEYNLFVTKGARARAA